MSETAWSELEDAVDPPEVRTVTRINCGKINFHTGSAVFPHRGIDVIKGVLLYLDQLGDKKVKVLIAAHTDTQDSHANNQVLSDQRARSTLHMLEFDREAWARLCHEESKGSKPKDIRDVLKWAAKSQEWSCASGDQARDVRAFKEAYLVNFPNTDLTDVTAAVDMAFWARVFNLYQTTLYGFLRSVKEQSRQRFLANLEWVAPAHKAIGCSEREPIKATADEVNEPENRRVEFLFFAPGQEPRPDDPDLPARDDRQPRGGDLPPLYLEALYDPRRYKFYDLDCPRPHWMGRELPPGNILFVIDASGSMRAKKKWVRLKRALVGAINALSDTDHFGVLAYESRVTVLWGTTEASELRAATEANRDAAIDWVNAMEPGGATFTFLALDVAFKSVGLRAIADGGAERNTIEFLSDGAPTPRYRRCEACTKGFELTHGATCPHCAAVNRGQLRTPADWSAAKERATLIEEVRAKNTAGWVLNSTAFVDPLPAGTRPGTKNPLSVFMEELSRQTDPPGSFREFVFP